MAFKFNISPLYTFFVSFAHFAFLSIQLSSAINLNVSGLLATRFVIIFLPNPSFIDRIPFLFLYMDNGLSISRFEVSSFVSASSPMSVEISYVFMWTI